MFEHSTYFGVKIFLNYEEDRPWSAEVLGLFAEARTLSGIKDMIRSLSNAPKRKWWEII